MNFKELRKEKGKTQTEIALHIGIKQSAVAMWETCKSKPRTEDLSKLAEALDVPVEQIIACFTK